MVLRMHIVVCVVCVCQNVDHFSWIVVGMNRMAIVILVFSLFMVLVGVVMYYEKIYKAIQLFIKARIQTTGRRYVDVLTLSPLIQVVETKLPFTGQQPQQPHGGEPETRCVEEEEEEDAEAELMLHKN